MMNQVRIYGAGGHSQVIREILEQDGFTVSQTFDDRPEGRHHGSKNVNQGARIKSTEFEHVGPPVVIAIGNNLDRKEIATILKSSYLTVIHSTSWIANNVSVGEGTVIFAGSIIQPNTIIGKHVIINTAASVDHDCLISDFAHISPKVALCGHVEVGQGTHVGVGAVVIPKVKIGKWCTVGAGAVVLKDVPDYAVVVGNPARIIKYNQRSEAERQESSATDIIFIGSGISTSFTLLNLCEKLFDETPSQPLKIKVLEQAPEFNTGIPYGDRSGRNVLLINALQEFLPPLERACFVDWMSSNIDWLLTSLKTNGGELTDDWISKNEPLMRKNQWDDIFIPRRFFGWFIDEQVKMNLKKAKSLGLIDITFENERVIDLKRDGNTYRVVLESKAELQTENVVLAIGSLPSKNLIENPISQTGNSILIINEPYVPSLSNTIDLIKDFIENKSNESLNIAIIGANASALEILYRLGDTEKISERISKVIFLSSLGLMPDAKKEKNNNISFNPINLAALQKQPSVTAAEVTDAVIQDIQTACESNLGAASTVEILAKGYVSLFSKFNPKELKSFATTYGNEIGRRQRCAGAHYLDMVERLTKSNRLRHIKGRFSGILKSKDGSDTFNLEYRDHNSKASKILPEPVDIVINCTGGCNLNDKEVPEILRNLIRRGYAQPNESTIGFDVSETLECSSRLFIIGPLVAGNIIEGKPIWHVEHCGRIIWLSKILAGKLHQSFSKK